MVTVDVLVVDHPLARTRLTALRDEQTDSGAFRFALHELTTMLVYEATREIAVERYPVRTPVGVAEGVRAANPPCSSRSCGPASACPTRPWHCCPSRRWASWAWPATRRPSRRARTWSRCRST